MAQKAEIRSTLPLRVQTILRNFWGMALIFIGIMLMFRVIELVLVFHNKVLSFSYWDVIGVSLLNDLGWVLYVLGLLLIAHVFVSLISAKIARILLQITITLLLIVHLGLVRYIGPRGPLAGDT